MKKTVKILTMAAMAGVLVTGCGEKEENSKAYEYERTHSEYEENIAEESTREPAIDEAALYASNYSKLEGTMIGFVNDEVTFLRIDLDSDYEDRAENQARMYREEYQSLVDDSEVEEVYEKQYTEVKITAENEITLITAEGENDVWKYDEEKSSFSNGETTFYKNMKDFFANELSTSETYLNETYYGEYYGGWSVMHGYLKDGQHDIVFSFKGDGTAESTIDEYNFLSVQQYSIKGDKIYAITYDEELYKGEYDSATGNIVLEGMALTKANN